MINSTNRIGINRLVVRSIPFETPMIAISAIMIRTIHCQMSDWAGEPVISANSADVLAGSVERIVPVRDLKI